MRSNRLSYRSFGDVQYRTVVPREGFEPPTTLLRKQVLSPLSYRGLVSVAGVEPAHPVMGASSSSWCVCHSATPTYKSGPGRNRTDLSWASTERLNQFSFGTMLYLRIDQQR